MYKMPYRRSRTDDMIRGMGWGDHPHPGAYPQVEVFEAALFLGFGLRFGFASAFGLGALLR